MNRNSKSPSQNRNKQAIMGIDKSILNEDEINRLLKITSEKSLEAIKNETEML